MYGYYESCTLRPYPECSIPELETALPKLEQKRIDIVASLRTFLSSIRMLQDGTDPPDEMRLRGMLQVRELLLTDARKQS